MITAASTQRSGSVLLTILAFVSFVLSTPVTAQMADGPASAGFKRQAGTPSSQVPQALREIGFDQNIGQALPLDTTFRDEAGAAVRLGDYFGKRPVVLVFAYYDCPMLCTMVINGLSSALGVMNLNPGSDFEIVTVSFNPRDTPALAAAKKAGYIERYKRPDAYYLGDALPLGRTGKADRTQFKTLVTSAAIAPIAERTLEGTPMNFESITLTVADQVAHLTLNRPERLNALNKAALLEINRAMDQAEADVDVRVIVVSGVGRAFSSGFDLKAQMEQRPEGAAIWREILDLDFDTTMRFWNSPKPTIAAVHGACLAGAFELAMACDITIAAEDAVFGEPELKFGAGIVTMLLPWMTSPKHAKRIILSADDRIPARDALGMGLVSRVVAQGTHVDEALRTARGIALMDPNLVAETKKALNRTYDIQGLQTALRMALDIDHTIESHGSPDKRAFMDIARERGMREAIAWRDARFAKAQGQ